MNNKTRLLPDAEDLKGLIIVCVHACIVSCSIPSVCLIVPGFFPTPKYDNSYTSSELCFRTTT
jgi:hypothetical protein